jgi:hypothetical protein
MVMPNHRLQGTRRKRRAPEADRWADGMRELRSATGLPPFGHALCEGLVSGGRRATASGVVFAVEEISERGVAADAADALFHCALGGPRPARTVGTPRFGNAARLEEICARPVAERTFHNSCVQ